MDGSGSTLSCAQLELRPHSRIGMQIRVIALQVGILYERELCLADVICCFCSFRRHCNDFCPTNGCESKLQLWRTAFRLCQAVRTILFCPFSRSLSRTRLWCAGLSSSVGYRQFISPSSMAWPGTSAAQTMNSECELEKYEYYYSKAYTFSAAVGSMTVSTCGFSQCP